MFGEKRNDIPLKQVHFHTSKNCFEKSQKIMTLYKPTQNLKKPNLVHLPFMDKKHLYHKWMNTS
jgi:hypothetical protein